MKARKLNLCLLTAILLFPVVVDASERAEKLLILTSFAAIDYDQSAGWVTPGGGSREANPLLKEHPSRGDMLTFGVVGVGLVWAASEYLPESWAKLVLDSALASEQWNIEDNAMKKDGQRRRISATPIIVTIWW